MAGITDRSTRAPHLKTQRLGHGTLECVDLAATRRFYEEVLGLEVLQTSPRSLMVRKDTNHVYAVVETGKSNKQMDRMNHNGIEVGSPEEVDEAHEILNRIRDEYGIRKIQQPRHDHGDHSFFFLDLDENWWEIVAVRPGGYAADFNNGEPDRDLTGRHEFDDVRGSVHRIHTHDPEFRKRLTGGDTDPCVPR
jgi:catechol 2,3-dioxygenase-like lactoylglutathione lyase family enzyme